MAKEKKSADQQPSPEEVLEERVDAMMDTRRAGQQPDQNRAPEIDIFNDPKTAPEVAPDLLKKIGITDKAAKPATKSEAPPAAPSKESEGVPIVVRKEKVITPTSEQKKPVEQPVAEAKPETLSEEKPAEPVEDAEVAAAAAASTEPSLDIDNPETDKAVDDIVHNESDELLATEDQAAKRSVGTVVKGKSGKGAKLKALLKNKKTWLIFLPILIVAILAVPYTRYALAGLLIKKDLSVAVLDSKTHRPVSNATVAISKTQAKTDAKGIAKLKVKPGNDALGVSKQYYQSYTGKHRVGLFGKNSLGINLVATGRQVPVTVLDKVTGDPIKNAEVQVLNTSARTDAKGKAFIVLPANHSTEKLTIISDGFSVLKGDITITSDTVAGNAFNLIPSGTIYFLSNRNGTIDVVKSDLDGSDRQTVVTGTGKEDLHTTSLLASRDWRYLVLEAKRDANQTGLYLIDAKSGKMTKIEAGGDYQLVGWYGHNLIYDVVHADTSAWQNGSEQLNSYDAEHDQLKQLDQNQAEGNSGAYAHQSFANFYILDNLVSYSTQWYNYANYDLGPKTNSIRGVTPTGQNKKDYQTFDAAGSTYLTAALYEPQGVYYQVYSNNKNTYYKLEDGKVSSDDSINADAFNKLYPTFLLSPNGNSTFWSEFRDGKNTLFTGDANADNKKQIASLSDYAPYGWYNNYLLVSKNSSELYIMSTSGPDKHAPLKITDYYKPAQTYQGYGYGYGGL
jgi:hypothetical protein